MDKKLKEQLIGLGYVDIIENEEKNDIGGTLKWVGINEFYARQLGYDIRGDHAYDIVKIYYIESRNGNFFAFVSSLAHEVSYDYPQVFNLIVKAINKTLIERISEEERPEVFIIDRERKPTSYFKPGHSGIGMKIKEYSSANEDIFLSAVAIYQTLIDEFDNLRNKESELLNWLAKL